MKLIKPTKRAEKPPNNVFRQWCFELIKDKNGKFTQFTTGVILLNVVVMASEYQSYKKMPDGSLVPETESMWLANLRGTSKMPMTRIT